MKPLRILFELDSGYRIGERTFLGSLAFVTYIFGIPILLLNSAAVSEWVDMTVLGIQDPAGGIVTKYYSVIVAFMAISVGVTAFRAWAGIGLRAVVYCVVLPLKRRGAAPYFRRKVREDFKKCRLESTESIEAEIDAAILDSRRLKSVSSDDSKWLDNLHIWEARREHFGGRLARKVISAMPSLDSEINDCYLNALDEIKKAALALPKGHGVDFYVASVQPAFYLAMQAAMNDAGLDTGRVGVHSNTLTGPGTVQYCLRKRLRPAENANRLLSFVAPQSAFLTTEESQNGTPVDPRQFYLPVVVVTAESQTVFYLEGRSSAPRRSRRLFYLNNSTAEECVASMKGVFSERFQPELVEEFDDYKNLLRGRRTSTNKKLEHGDGIVLWSPLSDYFDDFGLIDAHLAGSEDRIGFANRTDSRIVLYVDIRSEEENNPSAALLEAVVKAFVLRISMRRRMLVDHRWGRFLRLAGDRWKINRAYSSTFQTHFTELFH